MLLLMLELLDICHCPLFAFLQAYLFPYVCTYGHHFCTKDVDDGYVMLDCVGKIKFKQSSHASHCHQNLIKGKLVYVEKMQQIMQVDFLTFQCVILRCKWWDTFYWSNVKENCDSGIVCINSKRKQVETKEPQVFSKHYNQVFFTWVCWMEIGGLY